MRQLLATAVLMASWAAAGEGTSEPWGYRPVREVAVPVVAAERATRVQSPIDAFLEARMSQAGIAPAPPADPAALIRRATLDLVGLPPTPEEVEAFLADRSERAFEAVIDRLLDSPAYGERWARHWLDLVRYADSNGFRHDRDRPHAFLYRDYVLRSFEADKPYERFVLEQLAGDELFPDDLDALIATGFYRNYPDEENATNIVERRQEILNEVADNVAATFLGLTMGCARCHDHKYDPVRQADYFGFQAFFAAGQPVDVPLGDVRLADERIDRFRKWEERTQSVRQRIASLEAEVRERYAQMTLLRFPAEAQRAATMPSESLSPLEQQVGHVVRMRMSQIPPELLETAMEKTVAHKEWRGQVQRLRRWDDLLGDCSVAVMAYLDVGTQAPPTYVLPTGSVGQVGAAVGPAIPPGLGGNALAITPARHGRSTGRRSALAKWIVDPDHALAARVMVNRIWQHHFGRALAATPSDLGVQGEAPTNPELLDWLALEFVRRGWSVKEMHRLIMTSAAYRRSSQSMPEAERADPSNRLWWRMPRRRLEAESVRDAMLHVAGLLNRKRFGPGVFPPLPPGFEEAEHWREPKERTDRHRRSIYIFVRRGLKYPMLDALDLPDSTAACCARVTTMTPPQFLTLLNDPHVLECAQALARRVAKEAGADERKRIERLYSLCYGRAADAAEIRQAIEFLDQQAESIGGSDRAAAPPTRDLAFVDLCHALLASNEFLYID